MGCTPIILLFVTCGNIHCNGKFHLCYQVFVGKNQNQYKCIGLFLFVWKRNNEIANSALIWKSIGFSSPVHYTQDLVLVLILNISMVFLKIKVIHITKLAIHFNCFFLFLLNNLMTVMLFSIWAHILTLELAVIMAKIVS